MLCFTFISIYTTRKKKPKKTITLLFFSSFISSVGRFLPSFRILLLCQFFICRFCLYVSFCFFLSLPLFFFDCVSTFAQFLLSFLLLFNLSGRYRRLCYFAALFLYVFVCILSLFNA